MIGSFDLSLQVIVIVVVMDMVMSDCSCFDIIFFWLIRKISMIYVAVDKTHCIIYQCLSYICQEIGWNNYKKMETIFLKYQEFYVISFY